MKKKIIEYVKDIASKTNLPYGAGVDKNALSGQDANDAIKEELTTNKPTFIARFGWTELNTIIAFTDGIDKGVKYGKPVKLALRYFGKQPELLKKK